MMGWANVSRSDLSGHSRQAFSTELARRGMHVDAGKTRQPLEIFDAQNGRWEPAVRSSRGNSYSFVTKASFPMGERRLFGLAWYRSDVEDPWLLIIPLALWHTPWGRLGTVLKSRDYEGRESPPEWGIDSQRQLLSPFRLEDVVSDQGLFVFPTKP